MDQLPSEIWHTIFDYVGCIESIGNVARVNRRMNWIVKDYFDWMMTKASNSDISSDMIAFISFYRAMEGNTINVIRNIGKEKYNNMMAAVIVTGMNPSPFRLLFEDRRLKMSPIMFLKMKRYDAMIVSRKHHLPSKKCIRYTEKEFSMQTNQWKSIEQYLWKEHIPISRFVPDLVNLAIELEKVFVYGIKIEHVNKDTITMSRKPPRKMIPVEYQMGEVKYEWTKLIGEFIAIVDLNGTIYPFHMSDAELHWMQKIIYQIHTKSDIEKAAIEFMSCMYCNAGVYDEKTMCVRCRKKYIQ